MKKIISIIAIISLLMVFFLSTNIYAQSLDRIDIQTDKTIIRPGQEVNINIQFGQELGSYTFNISYDKNIFEYVKVEGGTANDTTDKVKVVYYDTTGGSNPRSNMKIAFKAKENITTSNPTEFTVTAEGLANADASISYDDITTPIVKNVTVEPEYIDYTLKLEYTGNIIKEKEKEMTLSYSSPMGRYYEHARLIAEATTPQGASVKLLATDKARLEHDIIQSGWGDAQGYKIGGKDVSQVLNVKGVFSNEGEYNITLKLIDRDNSDRIIAQQTFNINVLESEQVIPPTNNEETVTPEETPKQETTEKTPTRLPKTGINIYLPIIGILIILISYYVYCNKKKN